MTVRDWKYVAAYCIPVLCIVGLLFPSNFSWATVIFVFGLIPLIEPLLGASTVNLSAEKRKNALKNRFFDLLLYLNLPIVYGTILLAIQLFNSYNFNSITYSGLVFSLGIVLGACGINVAHELGHRPNRFEQFIAQLLLLPSWYMHFFIEHNRGHHKNVATDLDPASAKFNESLYQFWIRSVSQSYLHAWKLENIRLRKLNSPIWSMKNQMIQYTCIQGLYLLIITQVSQSWYTTIAIIMAGMIGFLLLETINYVEHYGLRRKKLPSGRYERVQPRHSWNANYDLGRILLYELTRHSDHHFQASKKYQILDHHDEAPELPFGYPTAMLLALIPPLWFKVMNKRLPPGQLDYLTLKTNK